MNLTFLTVFAVVVMQTTQLLTKSVSPDGSFFCQKSEVL